MSGSTREGAIAGKVIASALSGLKEETKMVAHRLKEATYRLMEAALGRRNVVRLGRFLSNRSRLDVVNDIRSNGEVLVIETILAARREAETMVAFDVGANVGDWTREVLSRLPKGESRIQIFAFEPVASTRAILKESLLHRDGSSCVTVVGAALSNVAGLDSMFVFGEGEGTNSLYAQNGRSGQQQAITKETIDSFCATRSIERIDLVKVDTEGHDMAVLEGAREMLERQAIGAIQFEYNHRWIFAKRFLADAFALLCPLGYEIGKVTPFGIEFYTAWHYELESFREANYLACPASETGRFQRVRWWNE